MPNSVIWVVGIELGLILVTTVLLLRPKALFKSSTAVAQSRPIWGGLVFLGLTFLWSVITGIVLAMNHFTLRV